MRSAAWLVPSLITGSGGHRTIFQHAYFLQAAGYRTTIYLETRPHWNPFKSSSAILQRMFGTTFADVRVGWKAIDPADLVFATAWRSASYVRDLQFECRKIYLVQDLEYLFLPEGDRRSLAAETYSFGLNPITLGVWLGHELYARYKIRSRRVDLCANQQIYHPIQPNDPERAVCFIYQPEKPRRAAELGLQALAIVSKIRPSTKIYTYGSNSEPQVAFQHSHLGLLSEKQCNELYNRCAVGLCLSTTNPSRIPFEMMCAGLPVVELHRQSTLFDLPSESSLLCDQSAEGLAEGIVALLDDQDRRRKMAQAGLRFMEPRDLQSGFQQFLAAVKSIETDQSPDPQNSVPAPLYKSPALLASESTLRVSRQLQSASRT